MAPDDLNDPLRRPAARSRSRFRVPVLQLVTGALAALVLTAAVWAIVADNPLGGEPIASAPIDKPQAKTEPAAESSAGPAAGGQTVTIIDGKSGVRQEIKVGGDDAGEKPVGNSNGNDARLLEESKHGPIPRIAADGTRPLDLYSRADTGGAGQGPRIAIVVGGLGIGTAATNEALQKLPASTTLAFAPHSSDLLRWSAKARAAGHEILLQLPMEPFDYPDNDPGPQTLLTSLQKEQNIDRLHWFLSRVSGYVGVANFMGARFTSNEAALTPVLAELARRGLLYFDDGTSSRSVAPKAAAAAKAPFIRADVTVDAKPNWSDIDIALERLERIAGERQFAVGYASALPISIERIARWAKGAESRGIRIVPLSAIALRSRES